jgi:hypothetical protein
LRYAAERADSRELLSRLSASENQATRMRASTPGQRDALLHAAGKLIG